MIITQNHKRLVQNAFRKMTDNLIKEGENSQRPKLNIVEKEKSYQTVFRDSDIPQYTWGINHCRSLQRKRRT